MRICEQNAGKETILGRKLNPSVPGHRSRLGRSAQECQLAGREFGDAEFLEIMNRFRNLRNKFSNALVRTSSKLTTGGKSESSFVPVAFDASTALGAPAVLPVAARRSGRPESFLLLHHPAQQHEPVIFRELHDGVVLGQELDVAAPPHHAEAHRPLPDRAQDDGSHDAESHRRK